jgi:hypothetical protein
MAAVSVANVGDQTKGGTDHPKAGDRWRGLVRLCAKRTFEATVPLRKDTLQSQSGLQWHGLRAVGVGRAELGLLHEL